MEAMACSCCAIASRVGGNPELVDDGENGLLFDVDNVGATGRPVGSASGRSGTPATNWHRPRRRKWRTASPTRRRPPRCNRFTSRCCSRRSGWAIRRSYPAPEHLGQVKRRSSGGRISAATRSRDDSAMRRRRSGLSMSWPIAATSSCTSEAVNNRPSIPSRINSGIPLMRGATQGTPVAIASISTTGTPSAKLESTHRSLF